MNKYEKNFDNLLSRIEAVRLKTDEHQIIKIVAASKYVDSKEIEKLYNIGQRAFGENRVQDLKTKIENLHDYPIEWHYLGNIQTNKINTLLDLNPTLIHSCDSYKTAHEIDKRAKVKGLKPNILLQINSSYEKSKSGITPKDAVKEYKKISQELENVTLKGVMTIGANTDEIIKIKESFTITHDIFKELEEYGAKYCSMGMSSDFEIAIECGSNMLRIGSYLFS